MSDTHPRVLICVTMDTQTRQQLDLTLNGILANVNKFRALGLCNHEIAVIIIMDGMKNINNDKNSELRWRKFIYLIKICEFSEIFMPVLRRCSRSMIWRTK